MFGVQVFGVGRVKQVLADVEVLQQEGSILSDALHSHFFASSASGTKLRPTWPYSSQELFTSRWLVSRPPSLELNA